MINFRCSSRLEINDIERIIYEKNNPSKTILIGLLPTIIERYNYYVEIEINKRILPIEFSIDDKKNLLTLYGTLTRTAKKITEEVLQMNNPIHFNNCLYCGIGESDEIDHFLPQEHFPEFSILHKNLIPICGTCNKIKSSNIPGENGINYLHLIYDIIPSEQIFQCSIIYTNNLPSISFSLLPQFNIGIINSHYSNLNLKKRIDSKSIQYCVQIKALKDQYGSQYAKDELDRDFVKIKSFFGESYWQTELISQMILTNFVESIE